MIDSGVIPSTLHALSREGIAAASLSDAGLFPYRYDGEHIYVYGCANIRMDEIDRLSLELGMYIHLHALSDKDYDALMDELHQPAEEPWLPQATIVNDSQYITDVNIQHLSEEMTSAPLSFEEMSIGFDGEVLREVDAPEAHVAVTIVPQPVDETPGVREENHAHISDVFTILGQARNMTEVDRAWQKLGQMLEGQLNCFWVRGYDVTGEIRAAFGGVAESLSMAQRQDAVRAITTHTTVVGLTNQRQDTAVYYIPIVIAGRARQLWVCEAPGTGRFFSTVEAVRYRTEACLGNLLRRRHLSGLNIRDVVEPQHESHPIDNEVSLVDIRAYIQDAYLYPSDPEMARRDLDIRLHQLNTDFDEMSSFYTFLTALPEEEIHVPVLGAWHDVVYEETISSFEKRSRVARFLAKLDTKKRWIMLVFMLDSGREDFVTLALLGFHVWRWADGPEVCFNQAIAGLDVHRRLVRSLLLSTHEGIPLKVRHKLGDSARNHVDTGLRAHAWLALACLGDASVERHISTLAHSTSIRDRLLSQTLDAYLQEWRRRSA